MTNCNAARCGDGHVRAGVEACDDANASNTDACLTTCAAARCGDGHVRAGVESCDDGNNNDNDACRNNCTSGLNGDLGTVAFCGYRNANAGRVGIFNSRRSPLQRHNGHANWDSFCQANGYARSNSGYGNWDRDCAWVMQNWSGYGVAAGTGMVNSTNYPPNRSAQTHVYMTCLE